MSVSPREELLYTSGGPIFTPGARVLMAAAERTSIDHLALVARVTSIPWSHKTITIGETVLGRLHTQSIQQTDTHPWSYLLICLFACVGALARVAGFMIDTHRGLRRCFQGTQAGGHHLCALPLPHFSLLSPRKKLIHWSGAWIFVTAIQRTPPDHLDLAGSQRGFC